MAGIRHYDTKYHMPIKTRTYGTSGPSVVLLHGGPGAAGYMAPVAREIADEFRVVEPLQRNSSAVPLTVAIHVNDLDEVIEANFKDDPPALVGHSWGAMLALAYAAQHPKKTASLVLIGCGTFDTATRQSMQQTIQARMDISLKQKLENLADEIADPDERLAAMGKLITPIYSFDPVDESTDAQCDARAHEETWADMLLQQKNGVYPAAFSGIRVPTTMLHGEFDPHPGRMICDGLRPLMPQLEYIEWERCGHYPWLENGVRGEFYAALRTCLANLA